MSANLKKQKRERRQKRIRAKIKGTAERPRLSVFKSNTAIYAQIIDDEARKTLASASGKDATKVGEEIAKKSSIKRVVFDRGGYIYTGKVKALALAARAQGLEF